MRKFIHKGLAVLTVVALSTVFALPSFAADTEYLSKDSFWNWIAGKGGIVQKVTGYLPGTGTCTQSDDGYHHSTSAYRVSSDGSHFLCVCDYCGKDFSAYASDLQQSYEAQVEELPAPSYNSDGSLYISPSGFIGVFNSSFGLGSYYFGCEHFIYSDDFRRETGDPKYAILYDCENNIVECSLKDGSSYFYHRGTVYVYTFLAPIDGMYSRVSDLGYTGYYVSLEGTRVPSARDYSATTATYYSEGTELRGSIYGNSDLPSSSGVIFTHSKFYPPIYKVIPYDSLIGEINTTYNITTRPTSITGDYGIIGDNGQIIKVEGDKIVNETNNTVYNPVTGDTSNITDWSYDYSTRTYTVTLDNGTTQTITYGDENVVIKEGDTVYNVYYLVDGSGSETPDPGPDVPPACNHPWTETSTTPATCTVPGSRILTCSLCTETKTETIPAPGHKWTIKQEVKNEYDENGNQTQEGYTIWECSVCGEQQKTTDGTAPPGGGSGTGSGSSGGVFSGIFGLLVDFLGFFWNTFRDFVGEGVKGFLNALMDGTSSIFGLLNPFNWGG